jgi:heterodisulfide reductase subunit C
VKPVEVIISLKNMLADAGIIPDSAERVIKTFEETGRTTPVTSAVHRQRARFGLPPLSEVPVDEIQKLIQPAADEGERS